MEDEVKRVPSKKWMRLVQEIANEYYRGHYTLLSFTHEVKFSFGTILERDEISKLKGYTNINHAIASEIRHHYYALEINKGI